MKKFWIILVALMTIALFSSNAFCDPSEDTKKDESTAGECPVTHIKGESYDCLKCHVAPTFELKESDPFITWDIPGRNTTMVMINKSPVAIYQLEGFIQGDVGSSLDEVLTYLYSVHPEVKKFILKIHSGGGSLFGGYQALSVLRKWSSEFEIETQVEGFAASAAFYVFCGGETRLVGASAQLMWHALSVFKMFDIATPDSREEEARVLRHLQDAANTIVAEISTLTKEEIDEKIKNKELWVGANEAVRIGFATDFL